MTTTKSMTRARELRLAGLFLAALLLVGCDPPGANPKQKADALYGQRCSTCHGPEGRADGPAAGPLNPKPRSFADPKWQGERSDEEIRKIIVEGGASVGMSASMPPNPDLKSKPELLDALVAKIRSMRQ